MARYNDHPPSSVRKFKGVTVFDWDSEPSNERPSAFAASTNYAVLGDHTPRTAYGGLELRRERPARKRASGSGLWWAFGLVIGLASAGLLVFLRLGRV